MSKIERIYEVVDASNEENYWPLGLFLSESEAMSLLDGESPPYSDDDPESVLIEVRSRPVGFHPHEYTTVASRVWVRTYDDTKPDWNALPIKLKNPT